MHERESYAARIRDTPENRKSACYSFQFNRRYNRTALVVARTLHRTRICARHVCGTTVSQENGHDSATSFIDRDVETLQERNICPSFRSPLPSHTRPSFLHEFQLAGRRSKQEREWLVRRWCGVRKRQTLVPFRGLIPENGTVFSFLFRYIEYSIFNNNNTLLRIYNFNNLDNSWNL